MYALGACQCASCRKAIDRTFWNLVLDNFEPRDCEGGNVVEAEALDITPAYEDGLEAGRAAAQWLLDGNSTRLDAFNLLRGIQHGDPEILDSLPSQPLSGEWADGLTPKVVLEHLGMNEDDLGEDDRETILDEWERGYDDGVKAGAEILARKFLSGA